MIISSFQAKTRWERPRKSEKKNFIVSISSYPTCYKEFQKHSKKIRKIKKLDNAFFSSQNRRGNPGNCENKNYCSYLFLPNPLERIPKKMNKNSKN